MSSTGDLCVAHGLVLEHPLLVPSSRRRNGYMEFDHHNALLFGDRWQLAEVFGYLCTWRLEQSTTDLYDVMDPAKCLEILGNRGACGDFHVFHGGHEGVFPKSEKLLLHLTAVPQQQYFSSPRVLEL